MAEQQYKWIKPSEQLPEEYTYVLCWYEYFRYGNYNRMFKTYGIGFYDSAYNKWCGDVTGHKANVIAWMPLPEPPRFRSRRNKGAQSK